MQWQKFFPYIYIFPQEDYQRENKNRGRLLELSAGRDVFALRVQIK